MRFVVTGKSNSFINQAQFFNIIFNTARFSFAHGGSDGKSNKTIALKKIATMRKNFTPDNNFDALIEKERNESWKYGGKTVFGNAKPLKQKEKGVQLRMF